MLLTKNIFAQISKNTHVLMPKGAAAATVAIQKALKGMPSPMDKTVGHEGIPDFVTNLLADLGVSSPKAGWTDTQLWEKETQNPIYSQAQFDEKNKGQF